MREREGFAALNSPGAWIEERIPFRVRVVLAVLLAVVAVLLVALNYNPSGAVQPGANAPASPNESGGLSGPYGLPTGSSGGFGGVLGFLLVLGVVLVYFLFTRGPEGLQR